MILNKKEETAMKAMCIDENGEFCGSIGADVISNRFKDDLVKTLEATEAHAILERGENRGKVVLAVS